MLCHITAGNIMLRHITSFDHADNLIEKHAKIIFLAYIILFQIQTFFWHTVNYIQITY